MGKKLATILLLTTLSTTANNFHVEFDVGLQDTNTLSYKMKSFALDAKYTFRKYLYKLRHAIHIFFNEPDNPAVDTMLTVAFVAILYYAVSRYINSPQKSTYDSDLEETYKKLTKAAEKKEQKSIRERLKSIEKNIEIIREELQSHK